MDIDNYWWDQNVCSLTNDDQNDVELFIIVDDWFVEDDVSVVCANRRDCCNDCYIIRMVEYTIGTIL